MRCQTYAKTEDQIELKLHFSARHPQLRFSAQQKMQHLRMEKNHAFEDWIFVRLSSLVLASEWTTNGNKFVI